MGVYISLLMTIRADPWWATRDMVVTASRLLPGARDAQMELAHTIQKGSKLVETFLNDLLGEHAVMVMAAVQVAQTNVKTGKPHSAGKSQAAGNKMATEMRGGGGKSGAAAASTTATPTKEKPLDAKHPEVGGQAVRKVDQGAGTSKITMEHRSDSFLKGLANNKKALFGEHMVDYHVLRQEGMAYPHASFKPMKPGDTLYKVNHEEHRPMELCAQDLIEVTKHGIDSLWKKKNGKYLVVEAKTATEPEHYWRLRNPIEQNKNAKNQNAKKQPDESWMRTLNKDQIVLAGLLSSKSDEGIYGGAMQMSTQWIEVAAEKENVNLRNRNKYDRFVYLVALVPQMAAGLPEHAAQVVQATIEDKNFNHTGKHDTHGVSQTFSERDIAAVEKLRKTDAPSAERKPSQTTPPTENGPTKPKGRKR
jgi:hypothetical protein